MEGEIITIETAQKLAEYDKLKKQLEEYKKLYKDELEENSKLSELWCDSRAKIRELENQQKEFIEYLEKKEKEFDILGDPKNAGACKGILQKYKSIIGDDK